MDHSTIRRISTIRAGTVARAQHRETKKWYAVKTLQTQRLTKDIVDEMMNEIDIMMGLDHPNIVRPLELYGRKREIYFVIPFCSGGDLYKRAPYGEQNAARYVCQMCDAVAYGATQGCFTSLALQLDFLAIKCIRRRIHPTRL